MVDLQQRELVSAFKSGNIHVVEQLLTRMRPDVVSSLRTGFPSLTVRRKFRKATVVVSLLNLAAYWGWKDIAVCLVAVHNCSPTWKDGEGYIALHYAAHNGHLEVVKYFIVELHCDPMERSNNYTTPLHIASVAGHLNIVQYLVSEAHCDPSLCEDNHGDTPLHDACRNGHLNIAQYLISEARCNPSCEDIMGQTPLDWAYRHNHTHIIQYLRSSSIHSTADLKSDVQTDMVEQKEEDHIHSPTAGAGSGDPSSILSIADLAQVKRFLRNVNNWMSLGLELGLLYFTLQKIKKEQHGLIDECKTEMLAAWLQQQDNVAKKGVPSWEVLRVGLMNIDENELASQIDQEMTQHISDPVDAKTVMESPADPETVRKSPVDPETAMESPADPETVRKSPADPETVRKSPVDPQTAMESPEDPQTSMESPVDPETVKELTVDPETARESPADPETVRKSPVDPETVRESPEDPRTAMESPEDSQTAMELPEDLQTAMESPEDSQTAMELPEDLQTAMESPVDPETVKESMKVTVTMRIIKIEAQGYPGTGKTSLLNLAMGEDPAPTRDSTDFVEPPSRYMVSETSGGKWEKLSTDKILEGISTEVKKVNKQGMEASMECEQSIVEDETTPPPPPSPPPPESVSSVSTRALTEISQPSSISAQPLPSFPSISLQLQSNESSIKHLLTDTTQPTLPQHKKSNPYSAIASELIKEVANIKHSTEIFSLKWVIVSDCGGQPPFLDAAALFLRNISLRIIPLKLSDRLDAYADTSYFVGGNNCLTDSYVPLTNLQTIETFAKSVAATQPLCTPSTEGAREGRTCRCKFTIIGTFKDMEHELESVERKEEILEEVLQPYKFFQVCEDRFILPINAVVQPGPERDKAAEDLRKLIESSEVSREFKVKLRWFLFLLGMINMAEEKKKAVFSIKDDECFELGKTLGMEKDETIEAINFFHDIGLMMHFDGDLEDYVVVDDEPVLQKISQLLSVSFLNRKDFNKLYATRNGARKQSLKSFFSETPPGGSTPLSRNMQQNLQEYGRFHRRYLEFLNLTEKELDFFLKMLVCINAIAETKKEEYFMPCALPYKKEPEPPNKFPWIVRFQMKVERAGVPVDNSIPPPVGYLPVLVVFLITKFSSEFSYPTGNERQYRNYITLAYKTKWRVYIIERHLQLEFYFSGGCKFEMEFSNIRRSILATISLTEERLQIADGVERLDCFLCTCGLESSSSSVPSSHVCVYHIDQEKGYDAVCDRSNQSRVDVEPENLLWMKAAGLHDTDQTKAATASSILSIPDLAQVEMFLKKVNKWQSLGLQLGILQPTLEKIEKEQRGDIDECKRKMLTAWLQQEDNVDVTGVPCCDVLKAALRKIGEKQLASEINPELIVSKRRTPKLPSITHGCSWWIIVMVVIPVLLAVIAASYLLY